MYDTYLENLNLYAHCAHSADLAGGNNWLMVDLGGVFSIISVAVTNRKNPNGGLFVISNNLEFISSNGAGHKVSLSFFNNKLCIPLPIYIDFIN